MYVHSAQSSRTRFSCWSPSCFQKKTEGRGNFPAAEASVPLYSLSWQLKTVKTFRAVRPGMLSIMRKFWSKWNASVHEESFRSKWSTSRGGPLWPVGSVRTDLTGFGKALEKRPAGDEVEQIQFLILFAYKLMIGFSGKNRENYPIECFW